MKLSCLIINLFFLTIAYGQSETVGLLLNDNLAAEGYTLFTPDRNENAYLINNCGEVVHQWTFSEKPGLTCYLLENGNLLQAGKDSLEIRDWNNNVIWSFHVNGLGVNQHHDIEPLPNGNILLVLNDSYTNSEMFAQGLDTQFGSTDFKLDKIIELEPAGMGQANIVWEWKFYDHLIQDFDSSLPNYGVISDSPELLDMNYEAENESDFTHVNAIDYNPELDQILLSARHTNEIYIIDHSTTTLEASSHTGGDYGKGGDFLWRWGNPVVYGAGNISNQKLTRQHDSKWIETGSHIGAISVFNNGGTGLGGSQVHIIESAHTSGVYDMNAGAFLPADYFWSWSGESLGETVSGTIKCGVEILSNDNALIVETTKGKMTEVTPNGDVVWVYENPHGDLLYQQFDSPVNNGFFRASRYPLDYVGLSNLPMNALAIIENSNSLSEACSTVSLPEEPISFNLMPNPTNGVFEIQLDQEIESVKLLSSMGDLILIEDNNGTIDISHVSNGVYFVLLEINGELSIQKLIKQ